MNHHISQVISIKVSNEFRNNGYLLNTLIPLPNVSKMILTHILLLAHIAEKDREF